MLVNLTQQLNFFQDWNKSHGEDPPNIREDVQTTTIEVTTFSSDFADEEQFFLTQADGED